MDQTAEKVKMRNADTFGGNFPVRVYKVSTGWCQETHSHRVYADLVRRLRRLYAYR